MTNILAIETSSVYCSIGLAKNKEIYIEHSQEENTHGKNIFGFIDNLLKKSQLEKEDLDFIALSCLLYTSPSPRDLSTSRMPSSA